MRLRRRLVTAPTEVFKLRWGTTAVATRGEDVGGGPPQHGCGVIPFRCVEARQVHERVRRDDLWRKNSEGHGC